MLKVPPFFCFVSHPEITSRATTSRKRPEPTSCQLQLILLEIAAIAFSSQLFSSLFAPVDGGLSGAQKAELGATHTHTHAHIRTRLHTHARTRMHAHACTHTYARARARTHAHTQTHSRHARMHECMLSHVVQGACMHIRFMRMHVVSWLAHCVVVPGALSLDALEVRLLGFVHACVCVCV